MSSKWQQDAQRSAMSRTGATENLLRAGLKIALPVSHHGGPYCQPVHLYQSNQKTLRIELCVGKQPRWNGSSAHDLIGSGMCAPKAYILCISIQSVMFAQCYFVELPPLAGYQKKRSVKKVNSGSSMTLQNFQSDCKPNFPFLFCPNLISSVPTTLALLYLQEPQDALCRFACPKSCSHAFSCSAVGAVSPVASHVPQNVFQLGNTFSGWCNEISWQLLVA